MALISMTGFGRGEALKGGLRAEVEISSVNRKQLDTRLNLPRSLATLESRVVELLQKQLTRGQVSMSVRLSWPGGREAAPVLDREAAAVAVKSLREAAAALGLADNLGADVLLQIPNVMVATDPAQDAERAWAVLRPAVARALDALLAMRQTEGRALERDLVRRLRALERMVQRLERHAPEAARRYERQLRERLEAVGLRVTPDDPQLLKEVVAVAERGAITEELVRLRSHFAHTREVIASSKPSGRTLDFLCQEMFREINTIGSKSSNAAMTRLVVEFKTQLECVREQVQNVE